MAYDGANRRAEQRDPEAREWSPTERVARTKPAAVIAVLVATCSLIGSGYAALAWGVGQGDARWAPAELVTMHIAEYDESALTQAIDATDTRIALERLILRDLQRQHADDPSRLSAEAIEDSENRLRRLEKRNDMLIGKRFGG